MSQQPGHLGNPHRLKRRRRRPSRKATSPTLPGTASGAVRPATPQARRPPAPVVVPRPCRGTVVERRQVTQIGPIRLSLHESDPITGNEDMLYPLFYEFYRGYTIYSTQEGRCCIHGPGLHGCLRLQGQYVSFPDIEDAKNLIKYFRSQGIRSWQSMERVVPEGEYACELQRNPRLAHPMERVL